MNEEARIYLAPNIRDQAINVLQSRTDQRRDRRMLAAIEVNQKKQAKLILTRDKDVEKFTKLMLSAEKRLQQVKEQLDKIDDELRQATNMHNAASLLDQELGNG